MKVLKSISEHEVTASLFRYNYTSFRFGKRLRSVLKSQNVDKKIITNPNVQSKKENEIRERLMRSFNGDGIGGYLSQNFPNNVQWKSVRLSKKDLQQIKYLNYSYWNELSNHKRYITEGVKTIKKGIEIFNQSNRVFFDAFKALERGCQFPSPVLVTREDKLDLVIVDGHLRLTAYLFDSEYTPKEIDAYVGYSQDFQNWDMY
jgi:hypothetical protein